MKAKLVSTILLILICFSAAAYSQGSYLACVIPHIANGTYAGGSFRNTFILFNNNDTAVNGQILLNGDIGEPLALKIVGSWTGSQSYIWFSLDPGASQMLQTDGTGNLALGSAVVVANSPIAVSAIFSVYDTAGSFVTEAGVGSSQSPVSSFVMPVDTTGAFNTGLALANISNDAATVAFRLLDTSGIEVGRATRNIPVGGHLATFVAGEGQLFPSVRIRRINCQILRVAA